MAEKLPEFEVLRTQAKQRAQQAGQSTQEALKRRFAATGQIGSGSAVKQTRLAGEGAQRVGEESLGRIDVAEAQEQRRRDETAIERKFRERQQSFAEEQAEKQGAFQEKQFAAGEERFGKQFGLQEQQFEQDKEIKAQQLQIQKEQFEIDKLGQAFNFATQIGGSSQYLATFLQEFQKRGEIPTIEEVNAIHRRNIGG